VLETHIEADKAILSITDNGCGMDNTTLKRITEPFFTTRRNEGGSGLGLSVCSKIIKEHQGEMQMQSSLGQGTKIRLIFTLEQQGWHHETC
jgi:signal transduction histidine kinase